MKDGDIIQIAHVVTDVDETMKNYYETFGYGPWDVYDFKAPLLRESRYRANRPRMNISWRSPGCREFSLN